MSYTRRQFFSGLANAFADCVEKAASLAVSQISPPATESPLPPYLRPPGALPEPAFLTTCTRCTDCIEACPYDSIRRLGPAFGDAGGTPAIIPDQSPCYLCEDMPCISACEPLALSPTPREHVSMGLAEIDLSTCYQAAGQPCDYCVTRCPLKEAAITMDDRDVPAINAEGCVGCGVCAYLCPASAIRMNSN